MGYYDHFQNINIKYIFNKQIADYISLVLEYRILIALATLSCKPNNTNKEIMLSLMGRMTFPIEI